MPKLIDLTGQKFGRLKALKQVDNDRWGHHRWLCLCDCKNEIICLGNDLKRGYTKSCGCLQKEIVAQMMTEHGHTKNGKLTGIYSSWVEMKQRCTNPNHEHYKYYGGCGITVCKRWMKFEPFLKDMIEGWELGLTIHRRNNNKGYYKKNCEWATRKEQARNRRSSLYIPYKGKRWLFIELCEKYNMPYPLIYDRYYRLGWTLEKALTIQVGEKKRK